MAEHSRVPSVAKPERVAAQTDVAQRIGKPSMHAVLQLQQQAGNRAVGQQLGRQAQASAGSPLPAALQASLEQRSGVNLEDVSVHRDSAAPAAFNALATAQGNQIHLAPEQDQHLPHEAWHVVQQKQGRVSADGAIGGRALNSNKALEHEADAMGHSVMRTLQGPEAQPQRGTSNSAGSPDVLQRMVTQIIPVAGKDLIEGVLLIGRPKNLYGASMGDHSTAFTVQQNAVRSRLIGKTFAQALSGMDALVRSMADLPGFHSVFDLPQAFADRFNHGWMELIQVRNTLPESNGDLGPELQSPQGGATTTNQPADATTAGGTGGNGMTIDTPNTSASPVDSSASTNAADLTDDPNTQMLNLQEYVNAYLEIRELVPFSAMNIRELAPALAGKGKGEARPGQILASNEKGEPVEIAVLQEAYLNVFDAVSLAMLSSELGGHAGNPTERVSPGFNASTALETRIRTVASQHVVAMHQAFPNALPKLGITPEQAFAEMMKRVLPLVKAHMNQNKANIDYRVTTMQREVDNMRGGMGIESKARQKTIQATIDARNIDLDKFKARKDALDTGLGTDLLKGVVAGSLKQGEQAAKRKPPPKKKAPPKKAGVTNAAVTATPTPVLPSVATTDADAEKTDAEVTEAEDFASSGVKRTHAVQLVLGADGTVTEMRDAGRTASPFSGTMGAHTTAWVVHRDHIKHYVHGRSVFDGLVALRDKIAIPARNREAKLLGLHPIDSIHEAKLDRARLQLINSEKGIAAIDASAGTKAAYLLQDYISHLLTYINFQPAATLDNANTNAKKEGTLHTRLMAYESGSDRSASAEDLRKLINGLLDLDDIDSPELRSELRHHHHEIAAEVYPFAWAASGLVNRKHVVAKRTGSALGLGTPDPNAMTLDATATVVGGPGLNSGGMKRIGGDLKNNSKRARRDPVADAWPPNFMSFGQFDPQKSLMNKPDFGETFFKGAVSKKSPFGKFDNGAFKFSANLFATPLLTSTGDLTPDGMQRFLAAYKADLTQSAMYLSEGEGEIVANMLGVSLHVYRGHVPDGFTVVQNDGAGHCLIHALFQAQARLRNDTPIMATPEQIGRARKEIAEQLPADISLAAIGAAISSKINGEFDPGWGSQMNYLLNDPSVLALQGTNMGFSGPPSKSTTGKSSAESGMAGVVMTTPLTQMGSGLPMDDIALAHDGGAHWVMIYRK